MFSGSLILMLSFEKGPADFHAIVPNVIPADISGASGVSGTWVLHQSRPYRRQVARHGYLRALPDQQMRVLAL
jgi:hypothetical protein